MTPARYLRPLLIATSQLVAACSPPPSESSPAPHRAEATAATSAPTDTTKEVTTSAPERTVKEKATEERPDPKREPAGKVVEVEIRRPEYVPGPVTVPPGRRCAG